MWAPSAPMEQAAGGSAWVELRERHTDATPDIYESKNASKNCAKKKQNSKNSSTKTPFAWEEAGHPAYDWIELRDNQGMAGAFGIEGGNYIAPEYMKDWVLIKQGESFELIDPDNVHTLFVKNEIGIAGLLPDEVGLLGNASTKRPARSMSTSKAAASTVFRR